MGRRRRSRDRSSSRRRSRSYSRSRRDSRHRSSSRRRRRSSIYTSNTSSRSDWTTIVPYSKHSRSKLRVMNLCAAALHLIQAFAQFVLAIVIKDFREFRLPIDVYYLEQNEEFEYLETRNRNLVNLPMAPLISLFFFLSFVFHLIVSVGFYNEMYWEQINRGKNYFRWIEYSMSSTVMIWIIAMFFGVTDITLLICIAMSNATMCILGLFQEKYNNIRDPDAVIDWLPFLLGCFIGIAPWIVVYTYLGFAKGHPPTFVYAILIGYFVFFNTFPANMLLQYKRVGPWRNYIFGEYGYIVLSFASKTLLGWLVFGGLMQPNEYN